MNDDNSFDVAEVGEVRILDDDDGFKAPKLLTKMTPWEDAATTIQTRIDIVFFMM